ncbi:MAG TPA: hypothetical protein ENN65_06970, partial [Candidatus Hydrogenedentes bacterium]|nr:hypothetical protein [Candidatus Hydrogenedentota bacterium]
MEIDSIAFLRLRGDDLKAAANISSGRTQRGVETRSSLYTTQNGALRFPLTVGPGAFFEAGLAVVDYSVERADDLVEFQVSWQPKQPKQGEKTLLARRVLPAEAPPQRFGWENFRVDLAHLAGLEGELVLATQWSRNEQCDAPQLVAAWGNPAVWRQSAEKKPNILVICCDALRADALGCYGYK